MAQKHIWRLTSLLIIYLWCQNNQMMMTMMTMMMMCQLATFVINISKWFASVLMKSPSVKCSQFFSDIVFWDSISWIICKEQLVWHANNSGAFQTSHWPSLLLPFQSPVLLWQHWDLFSQSSPYALPFTSPVWQRSAESNVRTDHEAAWMLRCQGVTRWERSYLTGAHCSAFHAHTQASRFSVSLCICVYVCYWMQSRLAHTNSCAPKGKQSEESTTMKDHFD